MSNDYPTTLVLNLQQRVVTMENAIAYLTGEVQRLSGGSQGFQTSIPLQPVQGRRPYVPPTSHGRQTTSLASPTVTPQLAHASSHARASPPRHASQDAVPPPMPLSEILNKDEVVTFGIHTGRDSSGSVTTTFLLATFDGTNLNVTECGPVGALVGLSTAKPGEILFKFMHGLVDANLLPRTFNALPWRLASVIRNGQKLTLSDLRRNKQESE